MTGCGVGAVEVGQITFLGLYLPETTQQPPTVIIFTGSPYLSAMLCRFYVVSPREVDMLWIYNLIFTSYMLL